MELMPHGAVRTDVLYGAERVAGHAPEEEGSEGAGDGDADLAVYQCNRVGGGRDEVQAGGDRVEDRDLLVRSGGAE